MGLRSLVVLMVLLGCESPAPHCLIMNGGEIDIDRVAACGPLPDALHMISGVFGLHGLNPVDDLVVTWHKGYCVAVEGPTSWDTPDAFCIYGIAHGCVLDVAWSGTAISDTVLAHEALHCALLRDRGDPDSAHIGSLWQLADMEIPRLLKASGF